MTIYDKIKLKLEFWIDFRERRFRREKLAILTLRDMGIEYKIKDNIPLTLEELAEFASKYDSYRHEYDAVQKDNKDLRGSDYDDGKILAQEKQLEFGYESNFNNNVRKLKTLFTK
jgi:hypothetical protein